MVPLLGWVLYRTPGGLAVRMVGENPAAAEAQGSCHRAADGRGDGRQRADGRRRRVPHLSAFNSFYFDMVNGRGWICIALVVFASWRPGKALLGAILFGAFDAYQLRLQQLAAALCPTRCS